METESEKDSNGVAESPPKFNIPSQIDYTKGYEFTPLNGSQVFRDVITDTYVTASDNEDEMVKRIDDMLTVLSGKVHGFAGYLSFHYLQMTLFYIMKNYSLCLAAVDNMMKGVEAVEKFIFTHTYEGVSANGVEMRNYAFGESDEEMRQTTKFLHDSWSVAKMVHAKAASFESGYSLLVSELMLHAYNKQLGMMRKDCDMFRHLLSQIRLHIEKERDEGGAPVDGTEYMNIEDLTKEIKSNKEDTIDGGKD